MAYFTAEITIILGVAMSGIIALLTFAIIQAHYTWYNLSPQGKSTTSVTYEFLGKSAEALVYSYVGVSVYTSIPGWWSWDLIIGETLIIIIGRIIGVIATFYLFRLCFKKKTINFKELLFITWGGMIRGAIAFALVLKIPWTCPSTEPECLEQDLYDVARSTTLVIVIATTLIFGTFMKQA
jgi:NhaP-type Na+/H+ or K+/H+ antiporter